MKANGRKKEQEEGQQLFGRNERRKYKTQKSYVDDKDKKEQEKVQKTEKLCGCQRQRSTLASTGERNSAEARSVTRRGNTCLCRYSSRSVVSLWRARRLQPNGKTQKRGGNRTNAIERKSEKKEEEKKKKRRKKEFRAGGDAPVPMPTICTWLLLHRPPPSSGFDPYQAMVARAPSLDNKVGLGRVCGEETAVLGRA